jgi:FdhE protein
VTAATAERLARLGREHPEWERWLAALVPVLREIERSPWDAAVPEPAERPAADGPPLLAGAVLRVDAGEAGRWLDELRRAAGLGLARVPDPLAVLEASVEQDGEALAGLAAAAGALPEAFAAVAGLAAWPLLHACRRRWAGRVDPGWSRGHCPVCGAWPALAEARGVERTRRLRCARCGGDWAAEWLRCPYCDNRDHARLAALVSEPTAERRRVEVCRACRGYVKTLTTLQAGPAAEVALDDLASVDLDVAARAQGYRRPERPAGPLAVHVVARPGLVRRAPSWAS